MGKGQRAEGYSKRSEVRIQRSGTPGKSEDRKVGNAEE
jgi:hypothetical protein